MLDRTGKIITLITGLSTIGGATAGVWLGARGKADASEVRSHGERITVVEIRTDDIRDLLKEQRQDVKAALEQLGQLTHQECRK